MNAAKQLRLFQVGTRARSDRTVRTPRTDYKLTASGRRALEKYLDHMDALIKAARRT